MPQFRVFELFSFLLFTRIVGFCFDFNVLFRLDDLAVSILTPESVEKVSSLNFVSCLEICKEVETHRCLNIEKEKRSLIWYVWPFRQMRFVGKWHTQRTVSLAS